VFLFGNGVTLAADFIPEFSEGPHLAHFGNETDAGIHKERHAPNHFREGRGTDFGFCRIKHGQSGGQCKSQFLNGRGPCLLQMIGADIHGIPFRQIACGKGNHIGGEFQGGPGRKHMGAAREIFLDDVVLGGAGQLVAWNALPIGNRHIKGEEPRGGGIDGHRGVHCCQRNAVEQGPHVADMGNGDAHFPHFTARQEMIGIIAGLGRQVEGYGKTGLALFKIGTEQPVAFCSRGMAGIGAKQPGLVGWRVKRHSGVHFAMQYGSTVVFAAQPCRRRHNLAVFGPDAPEHGKRAGNEAHEGEQQDFLFILECRNIEAVKEDVGQSRANEEG